MIKRASIVVALAGLVAIAGYGLGAASDEGSWTGQINDSLCGPKNVNAACAKKCVDEHGGKYVFVNDKDNKVYSVEPQDKVAPHAGQHVIVKGTVDGDTIKVATITTPPPEKK
jgi:hypothetical protein